MHQSPIISRNNLQDPIQSKMHLSDFTVPSKHSQADPRKKQKRDELYCCICAKIYPLKAFDSHISEHKRTPKLKISSSNESYSEFHTLELDRKPLAWRGNSSHLINAWDIREKWLSEPPQQVINSLYDDRFINATSSYRPQNRNKAELNIDEVQEAASSEASEFYKEKNCLPNYQGRLND